MRYPRPCILPTQPATRDMLLASGLSPAMIRTHLESGALVRVRRGVYIAATAWPDDERGRRLVRARAELAICPGAILSHSTAAVVWGLPTPGFASWESQPPSVCLPSGDGAKSRSGLVIHHLASLSAAHVTRDAAGYAVTTVARTATDLAVGRPLPEALVLLDAAARDLCQSMISSIKRSDYLNPRLVARARELLSDSCTGRRSPALITAIALTEPARESAAESLSAGLFHLAGVPAPLLQQPIRTSRGTFFPDFYWREQRLIGECDGASKYEGRDSIVKEKIREEALKDEGNRIVRWMAVDPMLGRHEFVSRILRELGR